MLLWLEVRLMMTSAKKVVEGPADEPRDLPEPDDGPDGGASGAVPAVKALQASMAPRASMATRQSEEAPRGGSQPWTAAEY